MAKKPTKVKVPKVGRFIVVDEWLYGLATNNPKPYGYVVDAFESSKPEVLSICIRFKYDSRNIYAIRWHYLPAYAIPGFLASQPLKANITLGQTIHYCQTGLF